MCSITFATLSIGHSFWVSFWVSFLPFWYHFCLFGYHFYLFGYHLVHVEHSTNFTDEIKKKTVNRVHEAIKNRPQDIGNTHETLAKYRDGMLVEILRLHKDFKI